MHEHDPGCPLAGIAQHTDSARHASDAVNVHLVYRGFDAVGGWVAVRLSDGKSDGVLYERKQHAVRHQLMEQQCAYVRITPGGMNACQAESYLTFHRKAYHAGFRLADPDAPHGGRQLIPRLTRRDVGLQLMSLRR